MSYDLQVWSVNWLLLPEALPEPSEWHKGEHCWSLPGRTWQIEVGEPDRVLPEDVPEGVASALPGIAFRTELTLSPIDAGDAPLKRVHQVAKALAKASHGVVFDPQTDTLETASGVTRLAPLGRSEDASLLTMSWWFTGGPLAERDTRELVDVLSRSLPEALPRRYGLHEPPQFVTTETGIEHFCSFVREQRDGLSVVWYPHPPVADVDLGVPERIGGSPRGFRSGVLEIDIDADALTQPGWHMAIQRTWRAVSRVVRPFYVHWLPDLHSAPGRPNSAGADADQQPAQKRQDCRQNRAGDREPFPGSSCPRQLEPHDGDEQREHDDRGEVLRGGHRHVGHRDAAT